MALSPVLSWKKMINYFSSLQWTVKELEDGFSLLKHQDGAKVYISQKHFGYIINKAHVVLGLGGTANEQAAGLGKPVVTFWSSKRQVKPSFMKHQKSLLSESLIVLPAEEEIVSQKILDLIENSEQRIKLGNIGSQMMGSRGGSVKIADHIENFAEKLNT